MAGIPLDFTGVESGPTRIPQGDYLLKVKMVKPGASSKAKTPMIRVTYVIVDGPKKGTEIIDDLYLTEKTLWRVRAWLEAMGETKLGGKFSVVPRKYMGKIVGATVGDDEQEGYATKSRVTGYFDAENIAGDDEGDEDEDDVAEDEDGDDEDFDTDEDSEDDEDDADDEDEDAEDEDEDEDEDAEDDDDLESKSNDELKAIAKALGIKPIPQRLSAKSRPGFIAKIEAAQGDEETEEEPEEDEDDLADLTRQELKALIKDEGLEVKVYKSDSDDDLRTKIAEARPEDEDAEDDAEDDEEEEEETPPPPKKKAAAKGKPKRAAKPAEDDLDDLDLDDL